MMGTTVADRPVVGGERIPMSYEAWRAWDYAGKSEWVAGEVIVFKPAAARHGDFLSFLSTLLTAFVEFYDLGQVLTDSVEMHVAGRGRVPDLAFVRNDRLDRLSKTRFDGPVDLAIELASDDSVARDFEEKKREYQEAGVSEFWALDAREGERRTEFYHLVNRVYQPILPDAEGRIWSTVVAGFWIKPAWLWQQPLPKALRCLAEISLEAYLDGLPPSALPVNGEGRP